MKVFFPVEILYPSQAGGTSNTVYWLSKNLVKEGFEPVLIASDKGILPGFPLNRWSENESGKVIYVRTRHLNFPIGQTLYSLRHFRRADVVHISSLFYPTAFITAIAARLFGKKTIWSVNGELAPWALNHQRRRKTPILRMIQWLVGNYAVFHSTSEEETQHIREVFGEDARVILIPNFIELPEPVQPAEGNYLLYLGRIHPVKALENLFTALSKNERFLRSDVVLKIAGKGWQPAYEDQLRELVPRLGLSEKIEFVGHVEGMRKEQLLAGAKWMILPSHTENFGLVVLESLAQNTPVIASKGTPWDVLEKEHLGFWTDNSPEALSEVITNVLEMSSEEYHEYRRRGRAFVEENYDIRKNIGRWIEAYQQLS